MPILTLLAEVAIICMVIFVPLRRFIIHRPTTQSILLASTVTAFAALTIGILIPINALLFSMLAGLSCFLVGQKATKTSGNSGAKMLFKFFLWFFLFYFVCFFLMAWVGLPAMDFAFSQNGTLAESFKRFILMSFFVMPVACIWGAWHLAFKSDKAKKSNQGES